MYLLHSTTNTVISASISTDFQTHLVRRLIANMIVRYYCFDREDNSNNSYFYNCD